MSFKLLKFLEKSETRLSILLQNEFLVDLFSNIDNLTVELNTLLAKGFLKIHHEYDDEEGDDYLISITDSGKSYIKFKDSEAAR